MSKSDSAMEKADVISLNDEEGVKQILVNSVLGLWDVVNNLTGLRPSQHDRYRVAIFGSARVEPWLGGRIAPGLLLTRLWPTLRT